MRVSDVLRSKGDRVETIGREATLDTAVHRLAGLGVGALVVSDDGARVDGLLAERDVVLAVAKYGAAALGRRVGDVMTRRVDVCAPDDSLVAVTATMTRSRQRQVPVVEDGRLVGLVSIGDVVKHRLDELELEAHVLREAYLARG